MYWGDAHVDRIETARIDGTGRRPVGRENSAHYFAFLLHDGDIYITDWQYRYVALFYLYSETVSFVGQCGRSRNKKLSLSSVGYKNK